MDYTLAYAWIWELLRTDDTALPAARLQKWVDAALAKMGLEWPALLPASALPDVDQAALAEALGHLVAAKLRRIQPQTDPSTDIVKIHTQNVHFQYADPAGETESLTDAWVRSAYAALRRVSVLAASFADMQAVSLFQAAGPRRAQEARGVSTRSLSALFTLLADEWNYEQTHPLRWGYGGAGNNVSNLG